MSELGSLTVSLAANTAQFTEDLGKAAREARKRSKEIADAIEYAAKAITATSVAAAGAAAVFTRNFIATADEAAKLAQKVGVSVESLTALQYAGKLSDVSLEQLSEGLKQLNKSIDNNDPAFKRLNISLTDATGKAKSTEAVFREVADRFSRMKDGADKGTIAMDLFGKSGADLIPLLNGGEAGLRRMTEQAERFGYTITTDVAKAAEAFNDNLTILQTSAEGLGRTLATPLVSELADLTKRMVQATEAAGGLGAGLAGWFFTDTEEPGVQIQALTEKIDRLRVTRDELAKPGFANKLNDIIFGDVGDIDRQIAVAEKELQFLQKFQAEAMRGYYDLGAKPFQAAAASDPKAAADAARKAAEAAREQARAVNEAHKAMADMARVEMEGYAELAKLRADSAAADAQAAADAIQDAQDRVEGIRRSLMSEEELLVENYLNKQDQLVSARDLEVITQEEYYELLRDMEADHWNQIGSIRERGLTDLEKFSRLSFRKQSEVITGMLVDITSVVARENRAMFEINKIAAASNVALKSVESIANSYKFGTEYGGPVAGAAMAAIAGLATAAQIAAIAGTQFGGGGAAPSLAGGTAAPPVTPVGTGANQSQQTTLIQISGRPGDVYTDKQVRELMRRINEVSAQGSRIVFAG